LGAAICGLVMSAVVVPASADRIPTMHENEAEDASRKFLRQKFEFYEYSNGKRMDCRRGTRKSFKCRVGFYGGDISFKGTTRPHFIGADDRAVYFRVKFRLVKIDHYCLSVENGTRDACTKKYTGHWPKR